MGRIYITAFRWEMEDPETKKASVGRHYECYVVDSEGIMAYNNNGKSHYYTDMNEFRVGENLAWEYTCWELF